MDDLSGKIIELINNPKNLEKLKELSGLFDNINEIKEEKSSNTEQEPENFGFPAETMKIITKLLPLMTSFNKEDDTTRFLVALRPLLGEVRQKKLDEATKIMQIVKVLPLLKGQGIL